MDRSEKELGELLNLDFIQTNPSAWIEKAQKIGVLTTDQSGLFVVNPSLKWPKTKTRHPSIPYYSTINDRLALSLKTGNLIQRSSGLISKKQSWPKGLVGPIYLPKLHEIPEDSEEEEKEMINLVSDSEEAAEEETEMIDLDDDDSDSPDFRKKQSSAETDKWLMECAMCDYKGQKEDDLLNHINANHPEIGQ